MGVSLKCQYALRALFELGLRQGGSKWVRLQEVARAQAVPARFLENILNQLRRGGFVESRRGLNGGFRLARQTTSMHIAEIVRFMDGDIYSVDQHQAGVQAVDTVFAALWQQAQAAIEQVYQEKTLQDLLDAQAVQQTVSDYAI